MYLEHTSLEDTRPEPSITSPQTSIHPNDDLFSRAQFEAAWALTNIASTCKTKTVVDHGAVPALVRNLRHHNPDLREQCAWCLGNIAGDCAVRVLF